MSRPSTRGRIAEKIASNSPTAVQAVNRDPNFQDADY